MKWINSDYGSQRTQVGKAALSVGWNSIRGEAGYVATVTIAAGRTKLITSRDEAKAVVVKILRRTCEQILNELSPKEQP